MVQNERLVKVKSNDGEWISTPFCDIPKGSLFMLSEADGEPVGVFKALSEAWLNKDAIWTIKIEETNEKTCKKTITVIERQL